MPRINEPTVAEHRAARERALLDAAHALLLETGEAPSLPQVAERAGVSRTAMYHYFTSKQELLQAMVRDVFPRWTERIAGAMDSAPTPADRVLAYAVGNLQLVDEGAHAVGSALAAVAPGQELDERARQMHQDLQAPLVATLAELGVDSPGDVAALVNSVVHGATQLLDSGRDLHDALHCVQTVLGPLVRELGGHGTLH